MRKKVQIEFGAPENMLASLKAARKNLWGAPQVNLIILSAIYGQDCDPDFAHGLHLKISKLALFAAGAADCFTAEQYAEYIKEVKESLSYIRNADVVQDICQRAAERSAQGRFQFGIASASAANRYYAFPRELALLTLAAQYAAETQDQISASSQSLWLLCLYALDSGLALNRDQYRFLTENAHYFNCVFPPHHLRFQHNAENVKFILERASEQARIAQSGIYEFEEEQETE
jgi:hypothetical protein